MTGKQYSIPASVVWTVVAGLIVSTFAGAGGGLYSAMRINAGLEKLEALPGPKLLSERREYQIEKDSTQDRRLTRLERAVWGQARRFDQSSTRYCAPSGQWPGVPYRDPLDPRLAVHDSRRALPSLDS